jgi:hypothetical protein
MTEPLIHTGTMTTIAIQGWKVPIVTWEATAWVPIVERHKKKSLCGSEANPVLRTTRSATLAVSTKPAVPVASHARLQKQSENYKHWIS